MKKEEGDWSSEKRRTDGSTKFGGGSIIPDWASLPPELVEAIADRVLSTTDGVEAYMDMRAVCHSWHLAIPTWRSALAAAKASSTLAAVTDLRFRPRNWVMLDKKSKNQRGPRLFLHVPTGSFRRRRLRVLRGHFDLGASDGLIVLSQRKHPYLVCVLNPFTGDMLHFPELYRRIWHNVHKVMRAGPTSVQFTEVVTGMFHVNSMVTFKGNIYLAGDKGSVFQFVRPSEQCDHELVVIAQVSPDMDILLKSPSCYLVESAGELLLVRHQDQALKVFRVDVEQKLLEEVRTMGCRALFLGGERCVSVDANVLPSVNADCVYLYARVEHVYNLRDEMMEILSSEPMLRANIYPQSGSPWYSREIFTTANNHCLPPLSLIQVLLDYCNDRTCLMLPCLQMKDGTINLGLTFVLARTSLR